MKRQAMNHSRILRTLAALLLTTSVGCTEAEDGNQEQPTTSDPVPTEAHISALFDSLLDGVQLIESAALDKTVGPVDETSQPPTFQISFEGCVDGFVQGSLCVRDGVHVIQVVAPDVNVIRSVDQRYVLKNFGSVPGYSLTGTFEMRVDVTVDTQAQTSSVTGSGSASFEVGGELEGPVQVALTIEGGRNYTESTATPIRADGTFTYAGVAYPVSGGFQRE